MLTFLEEHPFEATPESLQRRLLCYLPTVIQCTVNFTDMLVLAPTRFGVNPHRKLRSKNEFVYKEHSAVRDS